MSIEFRVLGPIEVVDDAEAIRLLGGPRQRAVLAILLLQANRVVPVDRIADSLYDGARLQQRSPRCEITFPSCGGLVPGNGPARTGGESILETRPPGYLLRVEPDGVDAFRFERMTDEADAALDRGDPHAAAELARQALELLARTTLRGLHARVVRPSRRSHVSRSFGYAPSRAGSRRADARAAATSSASSRSSRARTRYGSSCAPT